MNPNEIVHKTTYSVQIPYIDGLSLKDWINNHVVGEIGFCSISGSDLCPNYDEISTEWNCKDDLNLLKYDDSEVYSGLQP